MSAHVSQTQQATADKTAARQQRRLPSGTASGYRRSWQSGGSWIMLALLLIVASQATLLALVFQGKWLVLLGPAVVCAVKAWETWSRLQTDWQQKRSRSIRHIR